MEKFLTELLRVVLIAAVPVCAAYTGKGITAIVRYISQKTDDALLKKVLDEAADAVQTAVALVNQTFVDRLKEAGTFDEASQREAQTKALAKASELLTAETRAFLESTYPSLDAYLLSKIEAEVRRQKAEKRV